MQAAIGTEMNPFRISIVFVTALALCLFLTSCTAGYYASRPDYGPGNRRGYWGYYGTPYSNGYYARPYVYPVRPYYPNNGYVHSYPGPMNRSYPERPAPVFHGPASGMGGGGNTAPRPGGGGGGGAGHHR